MPTEGFIGEIGLWANSFAPKNWAFCDGQIISIASNTALFSILGTTYGGDGTTTFGLPNLNGRAPIGMGQGSGLSNRNIGEQGGASQVTLTRLQIAGHTHLFPAVDQAGNTDSPNGAWFAKAHVGRRELPTYAASQGAGQLMNAAALGSTGSGAPHNNMPPYLKIGFIICLFGVFPSRN